MTPRRSAYLWALAVFVLGGVPSAIVLYEGITGIAESLIRIVVPSETLVTLDEAGTYTVFHESPSVFQGETFASDVPPSQIDVTLGAGPGDVVPMGPSLGTYTYNLPGRSGRSIGSFRVDRAGQYRINATLSAADPTERTVIALGHEKGKATLRTVFGGIGIAASGFIAFVIAILVLVLRSRSKSRIEAARLAQG